jgi:hypothetical protein
MKFGGAFGFWEVADFATLADRMIAATAKKSVVTRKINPESGWPVR